LEFQKIKEKPQYRFRKELFLKIGIFFSLFALTIISVFFYITEKSSYTQDTILDAHEYYLYSNLVESWGFPPDTLKVKETLKNLKLFGCIYKNNEKIWANPQSFSKDGYVSFSDSDTLGILYDIDIPVYVSFGEIYKEKYDYTVTYANYGDYEYLMALEYYLPSEITTKFIPGSIMTIIAVALLFIVIRNYLQPIQLMKNRILLLQKGDLESTIPIIGEDELADLSNEINKMIQEIKELLNRKQLLLSEVSHELLSPLARIRLLAEMLPEHKNKIRLADEIQFLKGMVTNLLMSDRLSGPYANLELSTINTEELINKTIAMFPNSYDKILVSGNIPLKIISIDITKTTLALRNLIENAIKYGLPNKIVEISANISKTKNIEIHVKNYGKGISKKNIEKITNPFFRIKDKSSDKKSGFGMGLSITKKIIEAHKGELIINSTINESTIFTISLPIHT
tara:strand:+ start:6441 stop:7805 length:1365 start_codon:yes stop_codon:yes gene_type:complete